MFFDEYEVYGATLADLFVQAGIDPEELEED